MSKKIDYLITGLHYNKDEKSIDVVEVRETMGNDLVNPTEYAMNQIVFSIKNGKTFKIAYKVTEKGENVWKMGADVYTIRVDGKDYLKWDENETNKYAFSQLLKFDSSID